MAQAAIKSGKQREWPWFQILLAIGSLAMLAILTRTYFVDAFTPEEKSVVLWAVVFQSVILFLFLFRAKNDYFEPPVFFIFVIMLSVIAKVPYLLEHRHSLFLLLDGREIGILATGLQYILLAFLAFCFGYYILGFVPRAKEIVYTLEWRRGRIVFLSLIILAIASVSAMMVVRELGVSSLLENFSAKRFLDLEGASGRLGTTLYLFFKLALTAKIVVYVCAVYLMVNARQKKGRTAIIFFLLAAAAISIIIPTMFNSRGQAMLIFVDLFLIAYFLNIRIKPRYIVIMSVLFFGIFQYTTMERVGDRYTNIIDSFMSHRYILDLTKTSQIFAFYSDPAERLGGETLYGWLFVPIPSSIMPDKPLFVDVGKQIGRDLFGYDLAGVPPGYVGELYMNFGMAGLIIGMVLCGFIMRKLWSWFDRRRTNILINVFCSMVFVRFGVFLFNNEFGTFMIKNLLETMPTVLVIAYAVKVRKTAPEPVKAQSEPIEASAVPA